MVETIDHGVRQLLTNLMRQVGKPASSPDEARAIARAVAKIEPTDPLTYEIIERVARVAELNAGTSAQVIFALLANRYPEIMTSEVRTAGNVAQAFQKLLALGDGPQSDSQADSIRRALNDFSNRVGAAEGVAFDSGKVLWLGHNLYGIGPKQKNAKPEELWAWVTPDAGWVYDPVEHANPFCSPSQPIGAFTQDHDGAWVYRDAPAGKLYPLIAGLPLASLGLVTLSRLRAQLNDQAPSGPLAQLVDPSAEPGPMASLLTAVNAAFEAKSKERLQLAARVEERLKEALGPVKVAQVREHELRNAAQALRL